MIQLSNRGFTPYFLSMRNIFKFHKNNSRVMEYKKGAGFTLTELLLATAILVFVLSSLLLVFINCIILNESSRNLTVAVSHAEFALEEIKGQDFSSIASSTWNTSTIASRGLIPLGSESLAITVAGAGTNPKNITANVTWKDRAVRDRSLTLETLFTEP